MLEDADVRSRHVQSNNEACSRLPGLLAYNEARKGWKPTFHAVLLNGSEEVADIRAHHPREMYVHVVGENLTAARRTSPS